MASYINKPVLWMTIVLMLLVATNVEAKQEKIEKSFSVGSGGTLILDSEQGKITVESWNKQSVEVLVKKKARKQKYLQAFDVQFEQSGDEITITGDADNNNKVNVKFIIKVPEEFNLDLTTGGGSIEVADLEGEVKVNTSGGSIKIGNITQGSVDAKTSGGSIKVGDVTGDLKVDTSGGSIRLGVVGGKSSIETSGGSIKLEQGGQNVKAHTSGGSIVIGPVKGKVDVDTSGGSIKVGMAEGDVIANTSGGSIKLEGSQGKVNVETSGGSIFVGSSNGPVKAETAGGSIKIYQAKGYIEASTAGGKIEAEMIQDDSGADTHIDLSSAGGSITLHIPEGLAATVSAIIKITRSAKRDYRVYSDFPLTTKGENTNKIKAQGELNGGGDKIKLSTTNGDIYIKKLDR